MLRCTAAPAAGTGTEGNYRDDRLLSDIEDERKRLKRKLYEADFESVESLKGLDLNADRNACGDVCTSGSCSAASGPLANTHIRHTHRHARKKFEVSAAACVCCMSASCRRHVSGVTSIS